MFPDPDVGLVNLFASGLSESGFRIPNTG